MQKALAKFGEVGEGTLDGSYTFMNPTGIGFDVWDRNNITFHWTNGDGDGVIVLCSMGTDAVPFRYADIPEYNVNYIANSNFNLGDEINSFRVIGLFTDGTTSMKVSGLNKFTDYIFHLISFKTINNIKVYNNTRTYGQNFATRKTSL